MPDDVGTQADPNGATGAASGATGAQAATGTQPQAGTATTQADGADGEAETLSLEEARKLRQEAHRLRERLKPLEQAERERREKADADLPELERAQKRVAELEATVERMEAERKDAKTQQAGVDAAIKLGFRNPARAVRLLDPSAIEYAEDGTPRNLDALLRKLATEEPYLTKAETVDFGAGPRGQRTEKQPTMNDLLRAAAGRGGNE